MGAKARERRLSENGIEPLNGRDGRIAVAAAFGRKRCEYDPIQATPTSPSSLIRSA
jgi:hypothetical protein